MITNRNRIVIQRVHHQHQGVGGLVILPTMKRLERRTLNRVAGVDQQDILLLFANAFDQRRHLCEATVVRFVCVVVDRVDVAVQIGGSEDRDLNPVGRKAAPNENESEHDDEC